MTQGQNQPVLVTSVNLNAENFRKYNQVGGGGRTRTCEAMRRLIYSQLPLPLGTLPRSTAAQSGRTLPADRRRPWNVKAATARMGARPGAFMGDAVGQSQPRRTAKIVTLGAQIAIFRDP